MAPVTEASSNATAMPHHPTFKAFAPAAAAGSVALALALLGCTEVSTGPETTVTPTPDVRPVVVFLGQAEGSPDVDVFAAAGLSAEPKRLTEQPSNFLSLSLSPDGNRLLISAPRGQAGGIREVIAMNLDGTNVTRVSGDDQYSWMPRWSPDGRLVAYTVCCLGCEPWVASANGDSRWAVGGSSSCGTAPAVRRVHDWSPDGRVVYHLYDGALRTYSAHIVDADGENAELLFGQPYLMSPEWSRDGQRVAYVRYNPHDSTSRLEVANADGSGAVIVVGSEYAPYLLHPGWVGQNPIRWWSPDDAWLAFLSSATGNLGLVRPDGSGMHEVPGSSGGGASVGGWAPDGRLSYQHSSAEVWSFRPAESEAEKLALPSEFRRNLLWIPPAG